MSLFTNWFTNGKVDGIFGSLAILQGLESKEIWLPFLVYLQTQNVDVSFKFHSILTLQS